MSDDRSDYDLIEAVNYSTLKQIWSLSPKHYQHAIRFGSKRTPAMTKGNLIHCAVLEPHLLERRYLVRPPDVDGRTKAGKAWLAEHESDPRTIVTEEQYANALALSTAVRSDPVAAPYLARGVAETTIVWNDEETGERMKCRPDWLTETAIVDLKSTAKIKPREFAAQAARLGYHLQFSIYGDGVEAALGKREHVICIAVEPEPPFDVVTYTIPDEVLDAGREAYREALLTLRSCRCFNRWPGVSSGVPLVFQLPKWATSNDEDDMGDLDWGNDD